MAIKSQLILVLLPFETKNATLELIQFQTYMLTLTANKRFILISICLNKSKPQIRNNLL